MTTEKQKYFNINYNHLEIDDIINRVPTWLTRSGALLTGGFMILVLFLSWIVKYPEVVVVPMILKSANSPIQLYAHKSGVIDTVYIEEKDTVVEDQLLIYIENTANLLDVNIWKSWLQSFIISGRSDSIFNFPPKLLKLGELHQTYSNILQILYEWNHLREGDDLKNQLLAYEARISGLNLLYNSLEAQNKVYENEYLLLKKNVDKQKILLNTGVINLDEYERYENQYLTYKRQQIAFTTEIASTKLQIIQLELDKNKAKHFQNDKLNLQFLSMKEMCKNANNEILEWENKYVIKSIATGVVSLPSSTKINTQIKEGSILLSVIPMGIEGTTYATIKVSSQDLSNIIIGNKVVIKLDAWPSNEYGSYSTIVDNIGVLPIPGDPHSLFEINISLKDKAETSMGKILNLKPEEPGVARIITKEKRIFHRIFDRFTAEHKH